MTAQQARDLAATTAPTLDEVFALITTAAGNGQYTLSCNRLTPEVAEALVQLGYTIGSVAYDYSQVTWSMP